MREFLIAAGLSLVFVGTGFANPPTSAPTGSTTGTTTSATTDASGTALKPGQVAKTYKAKEVCRREHDTGSRLSSRVCRTPEEWAALDEANRARSDVPRQNIDGCLGSGANACAPGIGGP